MKDSEKIDHLTGEIAALRMFAAAVINSYPDLQALADEFRELREKQIALTQPTPPLSEQYLEGQNVTSMVLLDHIDAMLDTSAEP